VIVAVAAELHGKEELSAARIALAAATILLSWAFTNTLFALHYAHAYYGEASHSAGGLGFPETEKPDYWDFVYFAFVIGTTFQTSDVEIRSRHIRKARLPISSPSWCWRSASTWSPVWRRRRRPSRRGHGLVRFSSISAAECSVKSLGQMSTACSSSERAEPMRPFSRSSSPM
jgi:hypothetical protein